MVYVLLLKNGEEILQIDTYDAQIVSIKAVQELIDENISLKKEIDDLKSRLEHLDKLIEE